MSEELREKILKQGTVHHIADDRKTYTRVEIDIDKLMSLIHSYMEAGFEYVIGHDVSKYDSDKLINAVYEGYNNRGLVARQRAIQYLNGEKE